MGVIDLVRQQRQAQPTAIPIGDGQALSFRPDQIVGDMRYDGIIAQPSCPCAGGGASGYTVMGYPYAYGAALPTRRPREESPLGAAASGAVTGATLGSVVPGVGTLVGAAVGGLYGAASSSAGKRAVRRVGDWVRARF